jgi:hypothetical protein
MATEFTEATEIFTFLNHELSRIDTKYIVLKFIIRFYKSRGREY